MIVRVGLGGGSLVAMALGFLADPLWFALAALLGAVAGWWSFAVDSVFEPLAGWLGRRFSGEAADEDAPTLTLDDTVRFLEARLRDRAPRHVELRAAIRLEEIYRLNKHDPARARQVIELVRARYPDAPELAQFARAYPPAQPGTG